MNPAVSVIMPVFNAEQYLKQSVESILDQSFTNFELIVINDGSTDSSVDIIQNIPDQRIILINQNNHGVAHALNSGIKTSRANFIARMDADDISEKTRLEKQYDYLLKNPDTALIGSNAQVIDMSGKHIYTSDIPLKWPEIRTGIPFFSVYHSSVMYRKDLALKAGLYDERISSLNAFEDQLLWNRIAEYGIIENLVEPLIRYRLQPYAVTGKSSREGNLAQIIIPELVSGRYPEAEITSLLNIKMAITNREKYFNYHSYIAKKYLFEPRERLKALKHILSALRYNPLGLKAFFYLILCFFPLPLLRRLKKEYHKREFS